jgi:hypothetical protein
MPPEDVSESRSSTGGIPMEARQNSREMKEGMSQVLDGCATCCDGIKKEAEVSGLPGDMVHKLDEAIQICKDVARQLRT